MQQNVSTALSPIDLEDMYLYAFPLLMLVLLAQASNSPFLHTLFFPCKRTYWVGITLVFLSFLISCCLINMTVSVYSSFFPKEVISYQGYIFVRFLIVVWSTLCLTKPVRRTWTVNAIITVILGITMENKDLARCISNRPSELADSTGCLFYFLLIKVY